MDYIKSLLFLIFFIPFLSALGSVLRKNKEGFTVNMLFGYITYSFFQAIGGITVQLLKIDYFIYMIYMIVLMIVLVCLIIKMKNISFNSFKDIKNILVNHFKKWYLLYIISFVLLSCALLMTNYLWVGNHQDDGWYLLKVALAPKMGNQYDYNYTAGFPADLGFVRGVNTFELDYAFWSDLLHIYPSVFCKATMAYLNYFLVVCGFSNLIILFKGSDDKSKIKVSLFFLLSIVFFALPQETLANHHLINLQDGWHFSTAMWYGSSIVQCLGPLLFFIPLFQITRFSIKDIFLYIMICVALISKSSQALPLIVMSSIIALIYVLNITVKNIKIKLFMCVGIALLLLFVPSILPSFNEVLAYMQMATPQYFKSPVMFLCIIILLILTLIHKENKKMILWSSLLLGLHLLIFVPKLNYLFINSAIYTFVAGRTITMLSFMTVVSAGIYVGLTFEKLFNKPLIIKSLYGLLAVGVLMIFFISHSNNIGLYNSVSLLLNNPRLIPESTIELSKKLYDISERNSGDLVVETESWITTNYNHAHTLATHLTIEAPNIRNLAAIHRYSEMDESNLYKGFDLEKQMIYENINTYPDDSNAISLFENLLKNYPIDILVTREEKLAEVLVDKLDCNLIESYIPEKENFKYYILATSDKIK